MRNATAAALAAVFITAFGTALAADEETVAFTFDRAQLASADGVDHVARRIRQFAGDECGVNTEREPMLIRASKVCARDMAAAIVAEISHPRLSARFQAPSAFAARP
ncbi:MAG: UrcA family protein [Pseudomonadota bacterium]